MRPHPCSSHARAARRGDVEYALGVDVDHGAGADVQLAIGADVENGAGADVELADAEHDDDGRVAASPSVSTFTVESTIGTGNLSATFTVESAIGRGDVSSVSTFTVFDFVCFLFWSSPSRPSPYVTFSVCVVLHDCVTFRLLSPPQGEDLYMVESFAFAHRLGPPYFCAMCLVECFVIRLGPPDFCGTRGVDLVVALGHMSSASVLVSNSPCLSLPLYVRFAASPRAREPASLGHRCEVGHSVNNLSRREPFSTVCQHGHGRCREWRAG